ncbi:hypothetical protein [Methylorubrum thiocyanatum]|uniref:hypothetical protein n=1 Tax=Methylorubrum thiocyanatum TaxID=47958 RepID=UPI003664DFBF
MPHSDPRRTAKADERHRDDFHVVMGLLILWGGSFWQLARAALWGVVLLPSRHDSDRWLGDDPVGFWIGVCVWILVGPFFMIGTAVFAWIHRNDPL